MSLAVDLLRLHGAADAAPSVATGVVLEFDARDRDRISGTLGGELQHGDLSGRVDARAALLQAATGTGELRPREAGVEASARMEAVPVALLADWLGAGVGVGAGVGGWAVPALGETLSGTLDASGTLAAPRGRATLKSPTLDARLGLTPDAPGVVATAGSGLTWTLSPAAFNALAGGRGWSLRDPATLELAVERLRIPEGAAGSQPEWASTRTVATFGPIRLRSAAGPLSLNSGSLLLASEALGRRISLTIAADARRGAETTPLRLAGVLVNARSDGAAGPPHLDLSVAGLPSELLTLLGTRAAEASRLLGPVLALEIDARQLAPEGRLRLRPADVRVDALIGSSGLSGPLTLRFGDGGGWGAVSTPEPLRLLLPAATPASPPLPGPLAGLRPAAPLEATLEIAGLRWRRWLGAEGTPGVAADISLQEAAASGRWGWLRSFDPEGTSFAGVLRVPTAELATGAGETLRLADVLIDVAAERPAGQPEVFVAARLVADDPAAAAGGGVRGRFRVTSLLDPAGRFRPDLALFRGDAIGEGLSVATLDRLLGVDDRLGAVLGPSLQAGLSVEIGPGQPPLLAATLESRNLVAGLSADLRGGALRLRPDARLQLQLDAAGADALRGRLHPLSSDLIRSVPGSPVTLRPRRRGAASDGRSGGLAPARRRGERRRRAAGAGRRRLARPFARAAGGPARPRRDRRLRRHPGRTDDADDAALRRRPHRPRAAVAVVAPDCDRPRRRRGRRTDPGRRRDRDDPRGARRHPAHRRSAAGPTSGRRGLRAAGERPAGCAACRRRRAGDRAAPRRRRSRPRRRCGRPRRLAAARGGAAGPAGLPPRQRAAGRRRGPGAGAGGAAGGRHRGASPGDRLTLRRMMYRRFGRTGLSMPVLSTGGMRYQDGWQDKPLDQLDPATTAMTRAVVERSLEVGIHHIETARGYGPSERQLGTVLPDFPREDLIVQTKIGPTETAAEFESHFAESLERLQLDHVDLLAIHGINNDEVLARASRKGGSLDAARAIQKSGRAKHIGFSTHAPTADLVHALDVDDHGFDYVNLHFYFIFQRHRAAVDRAKQRDMGVFIISPTDKGGMLYDPPERLVELCDPLHPIVFNDLWTLCQSGVDTLSVGAAKPEDFDLHLEAVRLLEAGGAEAVVAPDRRPARRRDGGGDGAARPRGPRAPRRARGGRSARRPEPAGDALAPQPRARLGHDHLRQEALQHARRRRPLVPGAKGETLGDVPEHELTAAVTGSPFSSEIPGLLRESVALLAGEPEKRLSES